jgi:electron transfer flavoprotein alpha subunit
MQNSEYIIAVNNDPKAPIFNIAHCGMVGDLYEVIPELLNMIEENEMQNDTETQERMVI